MKTENTPSTDVIAPGQVISLETRFGSLSRGRCWGQCYAGKTAPVGEFTWVPKDNGTLFISEPGYYIVGSSDGFQRKARASFVLKAAEIK